MDVIAQSLADEPDAAGALFGNTVDGRANGRLSDALPPGGRLDAGRSDVRLTVGVVEAGC